MRTISAIAAALLAGSAASTSLPVSAHESHSEEQEFAPKQVGAQFMVVETTANDAAREPFLRGLALLHNFEYDYAAEAFRAAQAADPDFVMAYWGEAMTHNHPLWEQQDYEAATAVLQRLGETREARAAKARNAIEAQWLGAIETLYGDGEKEARDLEYLAAMRAMLADHPGDIDVRAFTGLAVLGTSHGGRQVPLYMEAAGILEPGFMTNEFHPGILHYLIHSYDDPVHAPLGKRMAERYAVVAPEAGHAQHMVSHIFHALADWEASEKANILADRVVDQQRAASGRPSSDCGHYNEWLVYALLQQGKDASQRVAACRVAAQEQLSTGARNRLGFGNASSYASIAAWHGVDTGNWPEPMAISGDGFILLRMMQAHMRALEHMDDPAIVGEALNDLRSLSGEFAQVLSQVAPDDRTSTPWLERAVDQVDAIRVLASGDTDAGLSALRAAAEAESALPVVFGPPAIAKPSWELLGEQYLALGRFAEAAEAFRKSLQFAPGRRLSREGLEMARSGG
ncbi:hypothetical protein CD351_06775 [Erythrobacter sp. KY5]|uniref:tetratricopeptide repeat protein n=1 Tax=Erythrobacter sp. KY5 TaxID=2011159 RepID=UPI000DBF157B|nr:tetratricopeptide repeat protein [Erythrobacter sp. KY5]AWW74130.1 hypothetical protein CD351_06775 [Erythrobacter sp. KY5]